MSEYVKDTRSFLERAVPNSDPPTRTFPFAGNGGRFKRDGNVPDFRLRALSAIEKQEASSAAMKALRPLFEGPDLFSDSGAMALEIERKVQVLARVLVDPGDPRRLATARSDEHGKDAQRPNPQRIKELLEEDEISRLFREWEDFDRERSVLAHGAFEECLTEAREVGKGLTPPQSLLRFDCATLAFTVTSLAKALYEQMTSRSSDSSQQNLSSQDSTDSSSGSLENQTESMT